MRGKPVKPLSALLRDPAKRQINYLHVLNFDERGESRNGRDKKLPKSVLDEVFPPPPENCTTLPKVFCFLLLQLQEYRINERNDTTPERFIEFVTELSDETPSYRRIYRKDSYPYLVCDSLKKVYDMDPNVTAKVRAQVLDFIFEQNIPAMHALSESNPQLYRKAVHQILEHIPLPEVVAIDRVVAQSNLVSKGGFFGIGREPNRFGIKSFLDKQSVPKDVQAIIASHATNGDTSLTETRSIINRIKTYENVASYERQMGGLCKAINKSKTPDTLYQALNSALGKKIETKDFTPYSDVLKSVILKKYHFISGGSVDRLLEDSRKHLDEKQGNRLHASYDKYVSRSASVSFSDVLLATQRRTFTLRLTAQAEKMEESQIAK